MGSGTGLVSAPPLRVKAEVCFAAKLTVDYGRSVEAGIAAGNYGYVNEHITAMNFPHRPALRKGVVKVDLAVVRLNRPAGIFLELFEILEYLEKDPLWDRFMLSQLPDLLTIGENHPSLQEEFPIWSLGSSWIQGINRFFPVLRFDQRIRGITLTPSQRHFSRRSGFLLVERI